MKTPTKIALGCAAVVAGVLAYRGCSGATVDTLPSVAGTKTVAIAPREHAAAPPAALEGVPQPFERALVIAPQKPAAEIQPTTQEARFYGSLLSPSGELLIGLWSEGVSLTDSEGRRVYSSAIKTGTFSFDAIPQGTFWATAGADGYTSTSSTIEIDAAHAQVQKDFTLRPLPILKVQLVVPDGRPLFEAMHGEQLKAVLSLVPVATKERPDKWMHEVQGSLNNPFGIGQFWNYGPRVSELPKGYFGVLMLKQDPPVFVSLVHYHRVMQTLEVVPGQYEVRFVVSPEELQASWATIQMRVVDAVNHAPIEGARARLMGGSFGDAGQMSDASGKIVIADREPGEFDLVVSASDFATHETHFLADSGMTTDLGEIVLDRGTEVEMRVVDAAGSPRKERFNLGTYDSATGTAAMERQRLYESQPNGVLRLSGLARREYVLHTANLDAVNDDAKTGPKWVSGNVVVDLREGVPVGTTVISLVQPTRVMVAVKGELADGLRFRVADGRGLELVNNRFWGNAPRALTLPPGDYTIALLDADGKAVKEHPLKLGTESARVEIGR